MKITDRRLYQARNLEDFAFRFYYRDEDNAARRTAIREQVFYAASAFVSPDTNKIWGVDVSGRWDGKVDFKVTANYGAKFEIAKAVDGTIPTAYFKENNQSAIDAELQNGAYAWLYPDNRINCTLQAKAYYDLVVNAHLRLPPAVDFEWTKYAGIQANPNYSDLRKWLVAFIRLSGVKPILYTAAGYIALFGAIPADILDMLAGVWVASYGGIKPLMPKGVDEWNMWQFTANGDALTLCPGNQGKRELDLNYMTEAFYSRYAGEIVPPTETGETMQYKVVWVSGVTKRTGPTTSAASVKDANGQAIVIPLNQIVDVSTDGIADATYPNDASKRWARFADGSYAATDYPDSTGPKVRMQKVVETQPVDEVSVNVNLDLTATINGKQYHGEVVLENVQLEAV